MAIHYDQPDVGYAWVILGADFVLHFLASSAVVSMGIFLVEYLEQFHQSNAYTAGIAAAHMATWGLSAFFVGPLIQKFGFRRMVQVGTTLVVTGLGCSALAPSVSILYLTHGLMGGLGFSCWEVSMCIVQLFFVRRQAFSVAVCKAGYSTGVLFWSKFTQYTIAKYGYRGALVVMAGIHLHGYAIAAIFRAPNFEMKTKACRQILSNTNSNEGYLVSKADENPPIKMEYVERSQVLETAVDHNSVGEKQCRSITEVGKVTSNNNGDSRPDDFPSRNCRKVCDALSNITGVSLLKIPTFSLFCVAIFLGQSGDSVPLAFIPLRLSVMGMSKNSAAMLIMYLGIGSTIGRVAAGWVADQDWADRKLMFACAQTGAGCISCIAYFISGYKALIANCILFAIISANYKSVVDTLVCDLVGVAQLAKGFGLFIVFNGAAQVTATSLSGHLIDVTGNGAIPFLVFGLVQACGGLVGFVVYFMARRQERRQELYKRI